MYGLSVIASVTQSFASKTINKINITGHSKVLKSINDFPFRLQRVYFLFCPVLSSVLFFLFSSFPIQCIFAKKVVGKKLKFLAKQLMLVSTVCFSMTPLVEHSRAESIECTFLPKIWSWQIFSWLSLYQVAWFRLMEVIKRIYSWKKFYLQL